MQKSGLDLGGSFNIIGCSFTFIALIVFSLLESRSVVDGVVVVDGEEW